MITRRIALQYVAVSCSLLLTRNTIAQNITQITESYANQEEANIWMLTWINNAKSLVTDISSKAPNGALHVGRFADPIYYLTNVIGWDPNPIQAGLYKPVRVPIGFVTDFASIPRIFWSMLRPDGIYSYAAIIHDYLYWEQYLPKKDCDMILKFLMEEFRINPTIVSAIYQAVNNFGCIAWEENARKKRAGEKRIIKQYPSDPTVRWEQWKLKSDVFLEQGNNLSQQNYHC